MSDDFSDIFEAEYRHDDRTTDRDSTAYGAYDEIRHCYDESQAIEVLAIEPGWLMGERFYMPTLPGLDDDEMFVQDFGFPKSPRVEQVFWMSIVEDEPIPSEEADKRCGLGRFWDIAKQSLIKWDFQASLKDIPEVI